MSPFLVMFFLFHGSTGMATNTTGAEATRTPPSLTSKPTLSSSEPGTDEPCCSRNICTQNLCSWNLPELQMWNACRNLTLFVPRDSVLDCCQSEQGMRCLLGQTKSVAEILGMTAFALSLLALIINFIFICLYLRRPAASQNPLSNTATGFPDKTKEQFYADGELYMNVHRQTLSEQAYSDLNPATKMEQEYVTLSTVSAK